MPPEGLLPLFPLPLVLFPRTALPLHIFEDRYKELIGEAIETETEFGVVMSRDSGIVNAGCAAVVERVVNRYSDGRMDILTSGRRRFELLELVEGKSYLRGRIDWFDDDEDSPAPPDLRNRAVEAYSFARQATKQDPPAEPEWTDPQLSFQLAQILNDLEFRQQLLMLRSEVQRLNELIRFFPKYVVQWRHGEHVREVAPQNGHSHILPAGDYS
jgi:Lon protease-like protein